AGITDAVCSTCSQFNGKFILSNDSGCSWSTDATAVGCIGFPSNIPLWALALTKTGNWVWSAQSGFPIPFGPLLYTLDTGSTSPVTCNEPVTLSLASNGTGCSNVPGSLTFTPSSCL